MSHVRITREQASRLVDAMNEGDIQLAELSNGNDGRLTAEHNRDDREAQAAGTTKPGSMATALEGALSSGLRV